MNTLIGLKISCHALLRNKIRSLLTMLGIIIGVSAVIAMIGIGQGARESINEKIASLGTNMLLVRPGSLTRGGIRGGWGTINTLVPEDALAIMEECPSVAMAASVVRTTAQVVCGNLNWSTRITGTTSDYVPIRQWRILSGRMFSADDVRYGAKVAVVGKTVAENLFQQMSPIGEIIRIKRIPFKVIGLLAEKGQSPMGTDQDDVILVPLTTARKRLLGKHSSLRQITVSAENEALMKKAQEEITLLLRERHRIHSGKEDDFIIRNMADIQDAAASSTRVMTIVLASIASVSLVVGGIGIMNIMLVSVTERTREIGIRMAVGATTRDILFQFLIESLVLSSAGGTLGVLLGLFASKAISIVAGWPAVVSVQSIILSFCFALVIGTIFGLYPARKASMLNPIEALRYE
ncbi:MAG: ABC transporter permease [Desulfobacteria bacterium]